MSREAEPPEPGQLRDLLRDKLPEYMVPSAFVVLPRLPLTTNGKVDRRALPLPDRNRPELDQTYVAPRTPVEELLAALWAEALGVERVGIHDNFFARGGHSLLATRVLSRVQQACGVELPLRACSRRLRLPGWPWQSWSDCWFSRNRRAERPCHPVRGTAPAARIPCPG